MGGGMGNTVIYILLYFVIKIQVYLVRKMYSREGYYKTNNLKRKWGLTSSIKNF